MTFPCWSYSKSEKLEIFHGNVYNISCRLESECLNSFSKGNVESMQGQTESHYQYSSDWPHPPAFSDEFSSMVIPHSLVIFSWWEMHFKTQRKLSTWNVSSFPFLQDQNLLPAKSISYLTRNNHFDFVEMTLILQLPFQTLLAD